MTPRRRWPATVMALLVAGSSAAIGVMTITSTVLAGPAGADLPKCGVLVPGVLGTCPPPTGGSATLSPSVTGGPAAIRTKWTGVAPDGRVGSVKVTLAWTSTGAPDGAPTLDPTPVSFTATCPAGGDPLSCDVAWPDALASSGYVLNGQYSLTTSASTCPTATDNPLLSCSDYAGFPGSAGSFFVANPATPPARIAAKLVTAPVPGVLVTWDPSPVPDVFAYQVERVSGTQATTIYVCTQIWAPKDLAGAARCETKMSWTDTISGGGKFTYRVTAARFGASYASKDRVLSTPAVTAAAVTVAGPPTPTVGTGKPTTFGGLGAIFSPVKPRSGVVAPIFGKLGPNPNAPGTTDSGFNPTLPYNAPPAVTDPPSTIAAATSAAAPKTHTSVGSIALIGAGVLVIVVALHGLWLRGEVKRSGALEALEPEL